MIRFDHIFEKIQAKLGLRRYHDSALSIRPNCNQVNQFWPKSNNFWSVLMIYKKTKKREMFCFLKQIVDLKHLYFWICCWSFKGNRCCMDSQIWNSQTSKKSSKIQKKTIVFTKKCFQMIRKLRVLFWGEDSGDPSRRRH